MNLTTNRCDLIIELIDRCLAELAPAPATRPTPDALVPYEPASRPNLGDRKARP